MTYRANSTKTNFLADLINGGLGSGYNTRCFSVN